MTVKESKTSVSIAKKVHDNSEVEGTMAMAYGKGIHAVVLNI